MLIDTTLREGAQMFGVRMDMEERKRVATDLAFMGVEEIEAGWVGMPTIRSFLAWSGPCFGETTVSIWSRCKEGDIHNAAGLGARRVNIGIPTSDKHRRKRLDTSRQGLLDRITSVVSLARKYGMEVSAGLEDASRADFLWLLEVARTAHAAGAFRIRLSDTVGVWSPLVVSDCVRGLREQIKADIAVHCHNDFGMGTANAMTALQSGADWADCSLLGVGERSGLAATEELAAGLGLIEGGEKRYRLTKVQDTCRYVAGLAELPMPRHKAIVGADIFACESGVHLHGMARDSGLFEPFAPEALGRTRRYGFSSKSGRSFLRRFAGIGKDDAGELLRCVEEHSKNLGRPLTLNECRELTACVV